MSFATGYDIAKWDREIHEHKHFKIIAEAYTNMTKSCKSNPAALVTNTFGVWAALYPQNQIANFVEHWVSIKNK
jgi:hypothetical protein